MSAAALEVKSLTANGVAFKVTGKSTHESHTSGMVSSWAHFRATMIANLVAFIAGSQVCR